ncbi:hypothetical protein C8R44DRAFT_726976 [Mycena epipterygia]|nr:hypothetical protein C8R44DRAFT_726976 [Mycena epipterygia]
MSLTIAPRPVEGIMRSGQAVMYFVFGLVVQTFFFDRKRGLKTKVNRTMFIVTLFMYLLSAAYWAYCVADVVDRMQGYISLAVNPFNVVSGSDAVLKWSPLFNAITLINYVLSDGIVVWRAWVICLRNHRKYIFQAYNQSAGMSFAINPAIFEVGTQSIDSSIQNNPLSEKGRLENRLSDDSFV